MTFARASVVEINVCQDQKTFPPFHFSEAQVKKTGKLGIVKTKLNEAAKGLNLKINYIKLPWKRCAEMFKSGSVDALLAAIWSKERQGWGVFPRDENGKLDSSKKILTARYSIFTHRDSKVSWDGKKVLNLTSGLFSPKGYVVTKILSDLGVLQRFTSDPTLIVKVVARKRLDGFVSTDRVAYHLIKNQKLESQIKKLKIPILIDDWHIPVSHRFYKNNPKLVQSFWDNLESIN
ncbi:hypothetical protein A9Q84_11185 [Halobacteriovorax marinus]|uniref:Uncharacterized protein n=1 Tax=Halobacteriovorax marinus TaxID=97084 RepID=A0A1Y5FE67_9BACT|nr:hypothetical protein A9Q84_11185 [Halobacteriovorax marinus]